MWHIHIENDTLSMSSAAGIFSIGETRIIALWLYASVHQRRCRLHHICPDSLSAVTDRELCHTEQRQSPKVRYQQKHGCQDQEFDQTMSGKVDHFISVWHKVLLRHSVHINETEHTGIKTKTKQFYVSKSVYRVTPRLGKQLHNVCCGSGDVVPNLWNDIT